jgi:hypothetical protein
MILTQNNITFLNLIDTHYKVIKSKKYKYINLGWNNDMIDLFIESIPENQILLIFPFITTSRKPEDSYLRLSNQFLINRNSNPKLIKDFLEEQWNRSDFYNDNNIFLYFKYKSVSIKQIYF